MVRLRVGGNIFVKWFIFASVFLFLSVTQYKVIINSCNTKNFLTTSPKKNTMSRQYLLTYSKANMKSRKRFPEAVKGCRILIFQNSSELIISNWGRANGQQFAEEKKDLKKFTLIKSLKSLPDLTKRRKGEEKQYVLNSSKSFQRRLKTAGSSLLWINVNFIAPSKT